MNYDFTIAGNDGIRAFFNCPENSHSTVYLPKSELLFLNERPLLRPNFMTEIEDLTKQAGEKITEDNVITPEVLVLKEKAEELSKHLPEISADNGADILFLLRDIYRICNKVLN